MKTLEKIVGLMATAAFYVTMVGLAAIAALTFLDVCLRYIFNRPVWGCYDITRVMLIATVACAFGYTQLIRANMTIDLLLLNLGKRSRAIINTIHDTISFGLFLVITWQAFRHARVLVETGDATETVLIPFYPFVFLIAFNMALVDLILLLQLIRSLEKAVRT